MIETVAAVVTAIGVVFAGIQLRAGQLQRNRQFESLYVQRYWQLLDRLSPEALRSDARYERLTVDEQKVLAMYVRLCEDQLEMRRAGAITSWTYGQWRAGMLVASNQPAVAEAIEVVSSDPASPCTELKLLVKNAGEHDPLRMGRTNRWLRGLN